MEKTAKIYVSGHRGLAGSAILRHLQEAGFTNLVVRTHDELDLCDQRAVASFFEQEKPEYVFLAAGRVGGIRANIENPAPFLYENLAIQMNVIHQAYLCGSVKKMLILGSSCIYPRECPQPMNEEYLMDGKLEPTNEGYALSKVVALKMGEFYKKQYGFNAVSIMPCNLYGRNDSFDPLRSHVLSATVRKFVDAVEEGRDKVVMWGTGRARREFLNVDDMAAAALFMMERYEGDTFINVGSGVDFSIRELAEKVALHTGFKGVIEWDATKPDGMMRKCLDVTRMKEMGFEPKISLDEGIEQMIVDYKRYKEKQ